MFFPSFSSFFDQFTRFCNAMLLYATQLWFSDAFLNNNCILRATPRNVNKQTNTDTGRNAGSMRFRRGWLVIYGIYFESVFCTVLIQALATTFLFSIFLYSKHKVLKLAMPFPYDKAFDFPDFLTKQAVSAGKLHINRCIMTWSNYMLWSYDFISSR